MKEKGSSFPQNSSLIDTTPVDRHCDRNGVEQTNKTYSIPQGCVCVGCQLHNYQAHRLWWLQCVHRHVNARGAMLSRKQLKRSQSMISCVLKNFCFGESEATKKMSPKHPDWARLVRKNPGPKKGSSQQKKGLVKKTRKKIKERMECLGLGVIQEYLWDVEILRIRRRCHIRRISEQTWKR